MIKDLRKLKIIINVLFINQKMNNEIEQSLKNIIDIEKF
jgi:hypothetical protein